VDQTNGRRESRRCWRASAVGRHADERGRRKGVWQRLKAPFKADGGGIGGGPVVAICSP
jgi:hypothetical protein